MPGGARQPRNQTINQRNQTINQRNRAPNPSANPINLVNNQNIYGIYDRGEAIN
jgi:hypothetical protein